jgi:hypothetical protein
MFRRELRSIMHVFIKMYGENKLTFDETLKNPRFFVCFTL